MSATRMKTTQDISVLTNTPQPPYLQVGWWRQIQAPISGRNLDYFPEEYGVTVGSNPVSGFSCNGEALAGCDQGDVDMLEKNDSDGASHTPYCARKIVHEKASRLYRLDGSPTTKPSIKPRAYCFQKVVT